MDENVTSRLGVNDKRILFASLTAMVDRLFFLNEFPVDMEDFALSCLPLEEEKAWRLLKATHRHSLSPVAKINFEVDIAGVEGSVNFMLHSYYRGTAQKPCESFPRMSGIRIPENNRFRPQVQEWCKRQHRLEDQILRANLVIKAIIHSCNTIGQYREVSPELITFLPEKYKLALQHQQKRSPYPAITVEPKEIETTMATLAYAALQPEHLSEEMYNKKPKYHHYNTAYSLDPFPRTSRFDYEAVRQLKL